MLLLAGAGVSKWTFGCVREARLGVCARGRAGRYGRYTLMMYIYGGVYADLDLESLKSMNTILQQGQGQGKKPHIVLGMESVDTETIDISFIASVPYHKLWLRVARAAL